MLPLVLFGAFLVGHALIHAGFVSPRPTAAGGPPWPFALDHSWLLTPLGVAPQATQILGWALLLVMVAGYATAIAAMVGLVGGPAFKVGIVVGSSASLAVLALFFHPWLVVGIALDAALLFAILAARWTVTPPS
jgi:hypothetical protein